VKIAQGNGLFIYRLLENDAGSNILCFPHCVWQDRNLLVNELQSLVTETKRKYPDVKEV
jgi:hypothetical protein